MFGFAVVLFFKKGDVERLIKNEGRTEGEIIKVSQR